MDRTQSLPTDASIANSQRNSSHTQGGNGKVIGSDNEKSKEWDSVGSPHSLKIKQEFAEEEEALKRQSKRQRKDCKNIDIAKKTLSSMSNMNDHSDSASSTQGLKLTLNVEHRNTEVEGNRLKEENEDRNSENSSTSSSQATEVIPKEPKDVWENDPKGLYGLKEEFLSTMNITPPITKCVHVTNFRCDKSELRDALELAGTVVMCSVANVSSKYAKVMYSHPLEAVQAISMLHDQVYYGMKLQVTMDQSNLKKMLPKGLSDIGPGLGENGSVVREIVREYERLVNGMSSKVNLSLFEAGNIDGIVFPNKMDIDKVPVPENTQSKSPQPNASNPIETRPGIVRPPINISGTFSTNVCPAAPIEQGHFFHAMNVPILGSLNTILGQIAPDLHQLQGQLQGYMPVQARMPMQFVQSVPGPISAAVTSSAPGVSPNWLNLQNTGLVPQMLKGPNPSILRVINLPPSTTFSSLYGKLSTLAQIVSLEFTNPGCAMVRFASPGEAEKCYQKYRSIQLS